MLKRVAIRVKETRKCAWKECGVTFRKSYALQQCCCAEHDRKYRESKGKKDAKERPTNRISPWEDKGASSQICRSRSPIRKVSKSQSKKDRQIAKNKEKRLIELGWEICECCEKPTEVDWAHLIPKSVRPDLYTEYDNGIAACRSCHNALDSWEIFTIRKFRNLPKILAYIEKMDTKRYLMLMDKLDYQLKMSR